MAPFSRGRSWRRVTPAPQRQTIELAEALLGPEDRYFAGFQILYRRDANARALSELTRPVLIPPTRANSGSDGGNPGRRLQEEPIRLLHLLTL